MSLYKMSFKSKDGAIEGEIAIVPEHDDRNDAGYDAIIPEGSRIHMKKLSHEEGLQMLMDDVRAGEMW